MNAEAAAALRTAAERIEAELRPNVGVDTRDGGYNCCGCSSYDEILNDVASVLLSYADELERAS